MKAVRVGTTEGPSKRFWSPSAIAPMHNIFYFYSYGDHRDLHSFPTRRSSDLRQRPMPVREWFHTLRQDVAYAFRQRRRSPGLTTMALLTLALAIGLTTAVFAVVDGVLLRPLPFPDSDRLVALQSVDSSGSAFSYVSSANWSDWNSGNRTLVKSAIRKDGRLSVVWGADGAR